MFTVCVGFVFRSKYAQSSIICSLQYSININTVEVDPHSDLLYICIVKPKNIISTLSFFLCCCFVSVRVIFLILVFCRKKENCFQYIVLLLYGISVLDISNPRSG